MKDTILVCFEKFEKDTVSVGAWAKAVQHIQHYLFDVVQDELTFYDESRDAELPVADVAAVIEATIKEQEGVGHKKFLLLYHEKEVGTLTINETTEVIFQATIWEDDYYQRAVKIASCDEIVLPNF